MLEPCVSDRRLGHYSGMHVYGKGKYIAKIGGFSEGDTEKWESKKRDGVWRDTDEEHICIYKLPRRFGLPDSFNCLGRNMVHHGIRIIGHHSSQFCNGRSFVSTALWFDSGCFHFRFFR